MKANDKKSTGLSPYCGAVVVAATMTKRRGELGWLILVVIVFGGGSKLQQIEGLGDEEWGGGQPCPPCPCPCPSSSSCRWGLLVCRGREEMTCRLVLVVGLQTLKKQQNKGQGGVLILILRP